MSVEAKRVDISIIERDEIVIEFVVTDADDAVLNITGGEAHWGLSALATDETFLVEKPNGAGSAEVADGPAGKIHVTLDAADSANLDALYHHRCKLTLAGKTETVAWGEFFVCPTPA